MPRAATRVGGIPADELESISPYAVQRALWPNVYFYRKQRRIIDSVFGDCTETVVPGANEAGKGFVAGFIAVVFFITRLPCRVVTTSAGEKHLHVLWGEIGRFIDNAAHPLDVRRGGFLGVNDLHVRRLLPDGRRFCKISYIKGMVANDQNIEAMQGHHATPDDPAEARDGLPRTLFISDESSGVRNEYKRMADGWAKRELIVGNCWPCEGGCGAFFHDAIEGDPRPGGLPGGDVLRDDANPARGHLRRVIRIAAEDVPNVAYGLAEVRAGRVPSNKVLVPGVKTYNTYEDNLKKWDEEQRTVSLGARFYKGRALLLFPAAWLAHANQLADALRGVRRKALAIGVDPGEGSADTVFTAVDRLGVIEQVEMKTPHPSVIKGELIAFGRRHQVAPEQWVIDRGGGGLQIASFLRDAGHDVRTVHFGEAPTSYPPQPGQDGLDERRDTYELRGVYANRRAEMYGEASNLADPNGPNGGFAIPRECFELSRQLGLIPKMRDGEGKLKLPPKHRTPGVPKTVQTLDELMGRSPDQADSLVLATWGMLNPAEVWEIGAM